MLGGLFAGYIAQLLTQAAFGLDVQLLVWALTVDHVWNVWTWILHLFAHSTLSTLLANAFWFVLLARPVEGVIGTARFVKVFLAAGVLSGLLAVATLAAMGVEGGVIGATPAILAVLGVVAPFNPNATIRSRSVPYAYLGLVVIIAVWAFAGLLTGPPGTRVAESVGLLSGAAYGIWLKRSGVTMASIKLV